MPREKREQAEQIIPTPGEVYVDVGRGQAVAEAMKTMGMTEQNYHR